jgi:hypothetical protein
MGGPDLVGAEKILLRAAVAGILSASNPEVDYPSTVGDIITSVNAAIASADRDTMLDLAAQIDADNNLGCPLNGGNTRQTIFSTGFEEQSERDKWHKDNSRTTTPNPGNIIFALDDDGQIGPKSGLKYLGGSGDIDDNTTPIINPAWAAYNRDSISISGYTDILLSLWYSYESTETEDEFALHYRVNGGSWQEILNEDPIIGNGNQKPWQQLQVSIPDGNTLEIEFRWETSQNTEHVMIDDLEITGILIP